jgi:hypothetical protein
MADTTTLWITQLYEFYVHTGNASFVQEMWPVAQRAIAWQVGASAQIGLPWHLVCTYDILVLEAYNTTTYNSFLHLLSMRAAVELAAVVGDAATGATAAAAFARGQGALDALLWNSTYSYYRAYTGGDAVMTDALYGQEIALHHGLGWLVGDLDKLRTHLAAELKYNAAEPYGLVTITGRHKPPPRVESENVSPRRAAAIAAGKAIGVDTQDNVIWTQSGPTWSAMQLRLAKAAGPAFAPLSQAAIDAALLPSQWQLDNVRSRLHDLWNFAGINTGATADWGPEGAYGMPFCTSHYVRDAAHAQLALARITVLSLTHLSLSHTHAHHTRTRTRTRTRTLRASPWWTFTSTAPSLGRHRTWLLGSCPLTQCTPAPTPCQCCCRAWRARWCARPMASTRWRWPLGPWSCPLGGSAPVARCTSRQ